METIAPWLTPALVLALFASLKRDMRDLRIEIRAEFKDFRNEVNARFDNVNGHFDALTRETANLRERMAKLEGILEGFVAGRRDPDAA